jgi:hypothetical protein
MAPELERDVQGGRQVVRGAIRRLEQPCEANNDELSIGRRRARIRSGVRCALGLLNLLYEIEERPTILNRARYRATWDLRRGDKMDQYMCDKAFDSFEPQAYPGEPERDHINPAVVRADREKLLKETEKVRLVVEQTFAHRARGEPEAVTWGEFHAALEILVETFTKYYALLTLKSVVDIEPAPQYNTHECLTFPWWEPGTAPPVK